MPVKQIVPLLLVVALDLYALQVRSANTAADPRRRRAGERRKKQDALRKWIAAMTERSAEKRMKETNLAFPS